jgi:hypothetical protein
MSLQTNGNLFHCVVDGIGSWTLNLKSNDEGIKRREMVLFD